MIAIHSSYSLSTHRPLQRSVNKNYLNHAEKTESSVDVDRVLKDLADRWDAVTDKTAVVGYGGGAILLLWLASAVVSAVDNIPLFSKLMELVGLSYTAWFTYRYLLFKSSRQELLQDIEELKKKVSGDQ